jgi:superoxide dismutase
MLSKNEVESMYFVEHYRVTELATVFAEKVDASLEKGNIIEWEPWAKKLRGYQNEERNWEWFWDSLTPEKDENGKPLLPEKGSKLYELIEKSFGDYERMREHYLESVGVSSDFFQRGQRAESKLHYEKTSGWIWVLYDSVEDKLVIKATN